MWSEKRIGVSGKAGCGNTTVTRLVSEKLGFKLINYTFKTLAQELGLEFEEICRLAEQDDRYDRQIDERQVELARQAGVVLGSRLAIWLVESADLKVYLFASEQERARRIAARENIEREGALEDMRARDERDRERFLRLYEIDIDRYELADLIIDTESMSQYDVADAIVGELKGE